jgi:hypothetical protein
VSEVAEDPRPGEPREDEPTPVSGEVVGGPSNGSRGPKGPLGAVALATRIQAGRVEFQKGQTKLMPIPGWEIDGVPVLWGAFRALDEYEEYGDILDKVQQETPNERERELRTAADCLAATCVGVAGPEEPELEDHPVFGRREPLEEGGVPVRLGVRLAQLIGVGAGVENDRQAVFSIFPSTRSVMMVYGTLEQFTNVAGERSNKRLQGN